MDETKEEGKNSKGSKNFCGFASMEEFSKVILKFRSHSMLDFHKFSLFTLLNRSTF
jgi:hypothetical protein